MGCTIHTGVEDAVMYETEMVHSLTILIYDRIILEIFILQLISFEKLISLNN